MLALLKNIDFTLITVLWMISLSFFTVAAGACIALSVRRIYKNNINNRRIEDKYNLKLTLDKALTTHSDTIDVEDFRSANPAIINEVLLSYFRTLKGKHSDKLLKIIKKLNIENEIEKATKRGTTGRRMEAMQVLSYLDSQSSLRTIHEGLSSSKKYITLTAARCLTRRKAEVFTEDIIYYINAAFPDEEKLLADILFRFGLPISDKLEEFIEADCNNSIKASCLEALVLMMVPKTSLNISALLDNPDERIRAGAVSLSEITSHNSDDAILLKALKDSSVKVKIRAAKIANSKQSKEAISTLYELSQDPLLWVRYWSIRAIWNTGRQGKKLVETMSRDNTATGKMAREVSLERQSLEATTS